MIGKLTSVRVLDRLAALARCPSLSRSETFRQRIRSITSCNSGQPPSESLIIFPLVFSVLTLCFDNLSSALICTGLLTRRGTIAPLSLARITAKAFILREGIYDVGGWTLTVNGKEGARTWVQNGEKTEIRMRGKERERRRESGIESVRLTVPVVA